MRRASVRRDDTTELQRLRSCPGWKSRWYALFQQPNGKALRFRDSFDLDAQHVDSRFESRNVVVVGHGASSRRDIESMSQPINPSNRRGPGYRSGSAKESNGHCGV